MYPKNLTLAVLAPLALLAALTGIRWGVPGAEKAAKVVPAQWNSPALFDALSSGWQDIYDKSRGSTPVLSELDGKYSAHLEGALKADFASAPPPPTLYNSYRSMIIRSRHPDEALPLSDLAQMKPADLDFRPPSFLYGGGYLYPLGAYYMALSKLGLLQRLSLRRTLDSPGALGRIYTAGRLLSAVSFAGLCCLCLLTAAALKEPGAGVFAFLFALTAPSLLAHAHYLTPHLWASFWGLASVFFLARALPAPGLRAFLLSGACLGVSAGSYWSQLHVLIFLAALLLSMGKDLLRKETLRGIAAMTAAGALVFLALNPYLLTGWKLVLREMTYGTTFPHNSYAANLAALFTRTLPATIGAAGTLAIICGYAWGLLSEKQAVRNLAAACVVMALLAAPALPPGFPSGVRRFFPWLALSLTLAGMFVSHAAGRVPRALRLPLLLLCFLPGALTATAYALNFARDSGGRSTYSLMGAELDALEPDGRLGLLEFPQPASSPHFRLDRWPLLLVTGEAAGALPDKDLPRYLLVTCYQKQSVAGLLDRKYELVRGFYPARVLGFAINPMVGAMNSPVELYKLRKA